MTSPQQPTARFQCDKCDATLVDSASKLSALAELGDYVLMLCPECGERRMRLLAIEKVDALPDVATAVAKRSE